MRRTSFAWPGVLEELHSLTPLELVGKKETRDALKVVRRVVYPARQLVEALQEEDNEA